MSKTTSSTALTKSPDPQLVKAAEKRKGTTIIRGRVNEKIVEAATAETLRISPEDVKVAIFDDRGKVGVDISTLLRRDDVMRCAVRPDQSVYQMVQQARNTISEKIAQIAGVEVGKINILLSGIKKIEEERGLQ